MRNQEKLYPGPCRHRNLIPEEVVLDAIFIQAQMDQDFRGRLLDDPAGAFQELGFAIPQINSSGWAKRIVMPDGEGNSWPIQANGKGASDENGLWANQVKNGQSLLGDLKGGDRVTWQKDTLRLTLRGTISSYVTGAHWGCLAS